MVNLFSICLSFLILASSAYGYGPERILGVWITAGGDSKVELFRCEEKICGKVVWLKDPIYRDNNTAAVGTPKVDHKNPDPALRDRPILGLQVMNGLVQTHENQWEHGTCYDPQGGRTYHCKMKLVAADKLELRGYIGISLFGRTFHLTRAQRGG